MYNAMRLCPLFAGLSDEEIEAALAFFDAKRAVYKKGDMVIKPASEVTRFGLVLSGVVQIMMDDIGGNHMIMATVARGQTFAESLCYRQETVSPVYAVAAENTSLIWLRAAAVRNAGQAGACVYCQRFIQMLTEKTLAMNNRIQILSKASLRDKMLTLLSQYVSSHGRTFLLPFDRNVMAAYLGTNRSALSRELSRMRAEGIIDFHKNRFTVLPNASLTEESARDL